MKKVFATILAVALVAVLVPTTVSASGGTMGFITGCNQHGLLVPCRAPMPPNSKGSRGTGSSASSTSNHGGTSSSNTGAGSSRGGVLPPTGIR